MFAKPHSKPQNGIFVDKTDYMFADPSITDAMKRTLFQKQDLSTYEQIIMALFYQSEFYEH